LVSREDDPLVEQAAVDVELALAARVLSITIESGHAMQPTGCDRGAVEAAFAQVGERLLGVVERYVGRLS